MPSGEAPFGKAPSSDPPLKDSQQTLLCTPAQCADTLTQQTNDVPIIINQQDDLCVLLTRKEYTSIYCQEERTACGETDDERIPMTPYKLQECASDSFGHQENTSMEVIENDDESCPMDMDDSTDSDTLITKLLDQPYCNSPIQQTPCDGLDTQSLQDRQTVISHVPRKQVVSCICHFLNVAVKNYGSLIPVTEKDVVTHLKEVFNQDFSDSISLIRKELDKCTAENFKHIGCDFRICYKKHTLYIADLETLGEQQWLNDQVINMYGELLMDTAQDKIHFFNTFFHKQFMTKGYDGVKRWTKKVDLFKKTLVLIPVHLKVHWVLVAVNIQNKTITFYNSQGKNKRFCTKNILRYIVTEAKERNRPDFLQDWQTTIEKYLPLQKNGFDCGVFMLQYCKCLAREQPFLFSQEDMPHIRKCMYKELWQHRLLD
ncbi:sentrin specific peptidase 5 [Pristimantis euphronides]